MNVPVFCDRCSGGGIDVLAEYRVALKRNYKIRMMNVCENCLDYLLSIDAVTKVRKIDNQLESILGAMPDLDTGQFNRDIDEQRQPHRELFKKIEELLKRF